MSDEVERVELSIPIFPAGARVWFDPSRIKPADVELLDNPNDRTNLQVVADAETAACDTGRVRRDEDGTCAIFWDEGDDEPIRGWQHCYCMEHAKVAIAALEAMGRLRP